MGSRVPTNGAVFTEQLGRAECWGPQVVTGMSSLLQQDNQLISMW